MIRVPVFFFCKLSCLGFKPSVNLTQLRVSQPHFLMFKLEMKPLFDGSQEGNLKVQTDNGTILDCFLGYTQVFFYYATKNPLITGPFGNRLQSSL